MTANPADAAPDADASAESSELSEGRTAYSPAKDDIVKCPACGDLCATGDLYCPQCGKLLPDEAFAAVAHLAPPQPTASEAFSAIVRKPPRPPAVNPPGNT
jgi:hypothetical protein